MPSTPNLVTVDWIKREHRMQLSRFSLGNLDLRLKDSQSRLLLVKMSYCELTPKLQGGLFWSNGERGSAG